jgi:hypothetical protein
VALATQADSAIRRAWSGLDLSDLDAGRPKFQRDVSRILMGFYKLEADTAAEFLTRYRLAEIGTDAGPVIRPGIDLAGSVDTLDRAAIAGTKYRIGKGIVDEDAFESARKDMMAEAHRLIIAGSRGTIIESSAADQRVIGWRRKSDGDPCTFCAMLVSRGPSYLSEATALKNSKAPSGWVGQYGNADPYHKRCACTVEPIYGDWKPTNAEEHYVDEYNKAAEEADDAGEARTAQNVLERMRNNGDFKDSPTRRRVTDSSTT